MENNEFQRSNEKVNCLDKQDPLTENEAFNILKAIKKENKENRCELISLLLHKVGEHPKSLFIIAWSLICELNRIQNFEQLQNLILLLKNENEDGSMNLKNFSTKITQIFCTQKPSIKQKNGSNPLLDLQDKGAKANQDFSFKKNNVQKFQLRDQINTILSNRDQNRQYECEILSNLNSNVGFLKALVQYGNTLELIYICGIIQAQSLIPLQIDFKSKKCHFCCRPILNFKKAIFCSNILKALSDESRACYKFSCKDCLGEDWDLNKHNLFYKCACCREKCSENSLCAIQAKSKTDPKSFIGKEIYFYHWRGKRAFVRGTISQFDRIRKMHKAKIAEPGQPPHKLSLEKESFFLLDIIPENSDFKKIIENTYQINFKDILSRTTDELLQKRGQYLYDYIQKRKPMKQKEGKRELKRKLKMERLLASQSQSQNFQNMRLLQRPMLIDENEEEKYPQKDQEEESKNEVSVKNDQLKSHNDEPLSTSIGQIKPSRREKQEKSYIDMSQKAQSIVADNKDPLIQSQKLNKHEQKQIKIQKLQQQMPTSCQHIVLKMNQKLKEQILNLKEISKQFPDSLLDSTIYIHCKSDGVWYKAKAQKYFESSKTFKIVYDDLHSERLSLANSDFIIADESLQYQKYQSKRVATLHKNEEQAIIPKNEPPPIQVEKQKRAYKVLGKRAKQTKQPVTRDKRKKRKEVDDDEDQDDGIKEISSDNPEIPSQKISSYNTNVFSNIVLNLPSEEQKEPFQDNHSFDVPQVISKDLIKKQLLRMSEKLVDGVKVFHFDLPHQEEKFSKLKQYIQFENSQTSAKPPQTAQSIMKEKKMIIAAQKLIEETQQNDKQKDSNMIQIQTGAYKKKYENNFPHYEEEEVKQEQQDQEQSIEANIVARPERKSFKSLQFQPLVNPQDLAQGLQNKDLIMAHTQNIESISEQFNIQGFIDDSISYFYEKHRMSGYKVCSCESCQYLAYPIMIKLNRDPSEYTNIHKAYLSMMKQHLKPNSAEEHKIPNVKIYFF